MNLTKLRKLAEEAKRLDVTCPVRHANLLSLLDLVDQMAEALEKTISHFGIKRLGESRLVDTEVRGNAHKALNAYEKMKGE